MPRDNVTNPHFSKVIRCKNKKGHEHDPSFSLRDSHQSLPLIDRSVAICAKGNVFIFYNANA